MSDDMTIPAGSLICFSTGEYSDYGYAGHFVTLKDVTRERLTAARILAQQRIDEATAEWTEESGEEPHPSWLDIHEVFIAELIRAGLLMAVNCHEMHIGSYGRLELD